MQFLCASKDVYCGGDIVAFPYHYGDNQVINIGHWQLASNHGKKYFSFLLCLLFFVLTRVWTIYARADLDIKIDVWQSFKFLNKAF